ncbi:copper homeostasis protein CutC [Arcanobacterium haemolyticum]|nr:copper homeostasis protein CutC [Arcanobacterium haemolyticum]
MTVIEICVEDASGVRAAREGGADRVELCFDLTCGGLTPHDETVLASLQVAPPLGIAFLVRNRPGNFVYTNDEVRDMCAQITHLRNLVDNNLPAGETLPISFVVGAVTESGEIDVPAARAYTAAAGDIPIAFHRAFDTLSDQDAGLEILRDLGYCRALTTGGDPSKANYTQLRHLIDFGGESFTILASGGLRSTNVADAVQATGAREIHMRAPDPDGTGTSLDEVRRIVSEVRRVS